LLVGVTQISAGGNHTCALMSSGGVRCWGDNFFGQLGDGSSQQWRSAPTADVITNAVAVAAGGTFTCALLANGGVRCWGDNHLGQLGDGTIISRATPPATDVLTGAKAITAGGDYRIAHACALLNDGTLSCWGGNVTGLNQHIAMPVAVEPFCR
jgi:alpha-tubulin suppressor-like RCC1 family protein